MPRAAGGPPGAAPQRGAVSVYRGGQRLAPPTPAAHGPALTLGPGHVCGEASAAVRGGV